MQQAGHQSSKQAPRIPVTILTGFLGAGKTSLLNHILSSGHGRRIAVLVNDFGSVNIDASLIDNRDGEVVSLANGCICCSLNDGLLMSVVQLIRSEQPPEHIIVETSGVSDPFEVARTFCDPELLPYAPLEGIVTVVDAELAPTLAEEMLLLAKQQVIAADVTVLNKVDLVDEQGLKNAHAWINGIAGDVRSVDTTNGEVPLELIFDIGGAAGFSTTSSDEVPSGDEHPRFDTFTYESDEPLSAHNLHDLLQRLPRTIYRVKGLVNLLEKPDFPCVLQSTGRRATLTIGQPWGERTPATQLVFIGSGDGVDAAYIEAKLSGSRS